MVTDITQTVKSLQIPVLRLIVFRFISIEPTVEYSQNFSWLSFEGASNYIIQLSNSGTIVFRETVAATNNTKETYFYKKSSLQPGDKYLFTVEIAPQISFLDYHDLNNEKIIAEYIAQGISKIKQLDLFDKLIDKLDSLLVTRNEILNLISGLVRQGKNSEIIGFLNYFLAQGSAFKLLSDANSADDISDATIEIASQLAAANITLSEHLNLAGSQESLVEDIGTKGFELALFAQDLQEAFQSNFASKGNELRRNCPCKCQCRYWAYKNNWDWRLICDLYSECRNCPECIGN